MELVILVVGGFVYYLFKTMEPMSARQAAAIAEAEGFKELSVKAKAFDAYLEEMCYDNCTICGKRSKFSSRCEQKHLKEEESARREEAMAAFRRQQEAWRL